MNINSLKPASSLARRFGVKSIIYGKPGSGKTPLMNSAPRPCLLVTEPGMLSMRNSNIPAFEAYTVPLIIEFFDWFLGSADTKAFDTLGVDSISQVAEIILTAENKAQKHGLKAYGTMSEKVMDLLNKLYYMPQKHIVLIAKQGYFENGRSTVIQDGTVVTEPVMQARPFFPGKDLNVKVPHLFDNVMQLCEVNMRGQNVKALRTRETPEAFARDRLGNLGEVEPPDLSALFAKSMQ